MTEVRAYIGVIFEDNDRLYRLLDSINDLLEGIGYVTHYEEIDDIIMTESLISRSEFTSSILSVYDMSLRSVLKDFGIVVTADSTIKSMYSLLDSLVSLGNSDLDQVEELITESDDLTRFETISNMLYKQVGLLPSLFESTVEDVEEGLLYKIRRLKAVKDTHDDEVNSIIDFTNAINIIKAEYSNSVGYKLLENGSQPGLPVEEYITITQYITSRVTDADLYSLYLISDNQDTETVAAIKKYVYETLYPDDVIKANNIIADFMSRLNRDE